MRTRKTVTTLIASALMPALIGCGIKNPDVLAVTEDATIPSIGVFSDSTSVEATFINYATLADDSIEYDGKIISIHNDVQTTLNTLGTPDREAPSPYTGSDLCYIYGTDSAYIKFSPFRTDKNEFIPGAISIYDDEVKTSRGIGIGSTEKEVLLAYGEPTTEAAEDLSYYLSYNLDDICIRFIFDEDKKVEHIRIVNQDELLKYIKSQT